MTTKSGSFASAQTWDFTHKIIDSNPLATTRVNDIHVGDINKDGLLDVFLTGRGGSGNEAAWYRNPGGDLLETWTRYTIYPAQMKYGQIGDLDSDGDLDLVAGDPSNGVYWYENTGNYGVDWPRYSFGISGVHDLYHLADIDKDGRPDLVYKTKGQMGWACSSTPKSSWSIKAIWSGTTRTGGEVADIDRDGDVDIVYGNAWFENPLPASNPRTASWSMHMIDSSWPTEAQAAVADLDKDGKLDIVLTDEEQGSAGVAWYSASNPKGSWTKHKIKSGLTGVHSLKVADFNQDGKPDVFAAEMHHTTNKRVAIYEQVSSYTWIEHIIATTGSHHAKVADLDNDGDPDIVGKNYEDGNGETKVPRLWRNNYNSILRMDSWNCAKVIDSCARNQAFFIYGEDVNGDAKPNIITRKYWYQNPGSIDASWMRRAIGGDLKNMAIVGDVDLDGDAEGKREDTDNALRTTVNGERTRYRCSHVNINELRLAGNEKLVPIWPIDAFRVIKCVNGENDIVS